MGLFRKIWVAVPFTFFSVLLEWESVILILYLLFVSSNWIFYWHYLQTKVKQPEKTPFYKFTRKFGICNTDCMHIYKVVLDSFETSTLIMKLQWTLELTALALFSSWYIFLIYSVFDIGAYKRIKFILLPDFYLLFLPQNNKMYIVKDKKP